MTVLATTGLETQVEPPSNALPELLRAVVDEVATLPRRQEEALRSLLGVGDPGQEPFDRFSAYAGMVTLLGVLAEDAPVLVIVDDVHWLDPGSIEALRFVSRRIEAEGVLLLLADRDGPSGDAVGRDSRIPTLAVEGLDEAAAGRLLEHVGIELSAEGAAQMLAHAEGNPLALIELAAMPVAKLGSDEEPGRLEGRLIEGYRQRLEAAPGHVRDLLVVAACSSNGNLEEVLAAAKELGYPTDALGIADAEGLVAREAGRIVFRHPLMRAAAARSADPEQRCRSFAALASVAGRSGAGSRHAWYLASAATGVDAEAADALEAVGRDALACGSGFSAAAALERAAELSPAAQQRMSRLLEAALLAGAADDCRRQLEALDADPADSIAATRADVVRGRLGLLWGAPLAAHGILSAAAARIE